MNITIGLVSIMDVQISLIEANGYLLMIINEDFNGQTDEIIAKINNNDAQILSSLAIYEVLISGNYMVRKLYDTLISMLREYIDCREAVIEKVLTGDYIAAISEYNNFLLPLKNELAEQLKAIIDYEIEDAEMMIKEATHVNNNSRQISMIIMAITMIIVILLGILTVINLTCFLAYMDSKTRE